MQMGLAPTPICVLREWQEKQPMATPGQLVQIMADVLGISKATVTQYDRVLAENGLRSKGGRGTSAAKVTPRDAANLLIALAVSPIFGLSAKDAVRNCETYSSLRHREIWKALNWPKNFAKFGLPTLADLPEKHSFGDALSALIDAAGKKEVFKLPDSAQKRYPLSTCFEIRFIGPGPFAEILADGTAEFGLMARLGYSDVRRSKRPRSHPLAKSDWQKTPDLRQISSVSFRTVHALGALISSQEIPHRNFPS
jgi:hypothetical protein